MIRTIVTSDIHGCIEELDELLRLISYTPSDRLIFGGDLVDRGPDSVGVVRRARELGAVSVMGNHDEWYVRCARHESNERPTGKSSPLRKNIKFELYRQFSADDLAYLGAMPYYYYLNPKLVVIHAGMKPGVPVENQNKGHLLRMRYLRLADNEMWDMGRGRPAPTPDVSVYWTAAWTGPEDVIYGHQPSKGEHVVIERDGVKCYGIDTGCCFGNKLTAMVISDKIEFASVSAKNAYADWHDSMGNVVG